MKRQIISFEVPAQIVRELDKAVARSFTNRSQFIRATISQALKAQGFKPSLDSGQEGNK